MSSINASIQHLLKSQARTAGQLKGIENGRNKIILLYTQDDFLYRKPKESITQLLEFVSSMRLLDPSPIFKEEHNVSRSKDTKGDK